MWVSRGGVRYWEGPPPADPPVITEGRPLLRTEDTYAAVLAILGGIRSVQELIERAMGREVCEGCGCLCLPDETCPGCLVSRAERVAA